MWMDGKIWLVLSSKIEKTLLGRITTFQSVGHVAGQTSNGVKLVTTMNTETTVFVFADERLKIARAASLHAVTYSSVNFVSIK